MAASHPTHHGLRSSPRPAAASALFRRADAALYAAKRSGRPVAVLCTSGTAAANLHPAVLEADHARAPLLLLTADRTALVREATYGLTHRDPAERIPVGQGVAGTVAATGRAMVLASPAGNGGPEPTATLPADVEDPDHRGQPGQHEALPDPPDAEGS